MRKIIVQFKSKDAGETLCFMANSCQEWLEGFVKALHDAQKTEAKETDLYSEWWAKRPGNFIDDDYLKDWLNQKPKLDWDHAGMFNYCGYEFDVSDFKDYDYDEVTLPSVYELDEWFDMSCVNPEE